MSNDDKSIDILGTKPLAEAVNTVTKGGVNGASAFLSRICLPAAEEFGLLLKDKVSAWRAKNAIELINKAQELLNQQTCDLVVHAHPRIVYSVLETGSWAEDDYMQSLWSGLLTSSCDKTGKDESNLMFINILSNLTTSQGKLVKYICTNSTALISDGGWLVTDDALFMDINALKEVMEIEDIHRLDRELDYLRSMELIHVGFTPDHKNADVTPTALCLQFYCRCQGFIGSPVDFYNAKPGQSRYDKSVIEAFNKVLE